MCCVVCFLPCFEWADAFESASLGAFLSARAFVSGTPSAQNLVVVERERERERERGISGIESRRHLRRPRHTLPPRKRHRDTTAMSPTVSNFSLSIWQGNVPSLFFSLLDSLIPFNWLALRDSKNRFTCWTAMSGVKLLDYIKPTIRSLVK